MLQVHRDMICKQCGSVNEHEQVTRSEDKTIGTVISMIIRCKKCGHEYLQGTLAQWSDNRATTIFNTVDWSIVQVELY